MTFLGIPFAPKGQRPFAPKGQRPFAPKGRRALLLAALLATGLATGGVALDAHASAQPASLADGGLLRGAMARIAAIFHPAPPQQVSITQHFSIRITPGGPMVPPDVVVELEQEETPAEFKERRMGKCLDWSGIAAVRGGERNRLLLFMRDNTVVSADLDKSCEARAFDSGFLFARTGDGKICVNRDVLQARSGAHCRMKRLRALVHTPGRRGP